MARRSPREVADKQIRKAQQATEDYLKGIDATTKSPMEEAKKKKGKLVNNFNAAVEGGKWEAGLDSVTTEEWKAIAKTKGGRNYAPGVTDARPKIEAFHEDFLPFVYDTADRINQMDDSTPEARIQKMVENARAIARYKRTRRRR